MPWPISASIKKCNVLRVQSRATSGKTPQAQQPERHPPTRAKTELLKVSGARRRARQAALDALLAEGKVIRIDKEYFANDPSGSVEELIHAEAVRLDAHLRSVPELLSRSGKKLRRAMKDNALASVALQRLLETGHVIEFKYRSLAGLPNPNPNKSKHLALAFASKSRRYYCAKTSGNNARRNILEYGRIFHDVWRPFFALLFPQCVDGAVYRSAFELFGPAQRL